MRDDGEGMAKYSVVQRRESSFYDVIVRGDGVGRRYVFVGAKTKEDAKVWIANRQRIVSEQNDSSGATSRTGVASSLWAWLRTLALRVALVLALLVAVILIA